MSYARSLRETAASIRSYAPAADPKQVDPAVKPVWWNERWIPITENGAGDSLCIDLEPASAGLKGQVIQYLHDHPERRRRATGFVDLLRIHADALESGAMVATEDETGSFFAIMPRKALTGSLADLRVRGETTEAARQRIAHYLQKNPAETARRLIEILQRNEWLPERPRLTPASVFAAEAVTIVLTGVHASPQAQAGAIHAAIAAKVDRLLCTPGDIERVLPSLGDPDRFGLAKGGPMR
jgi:hypothetical protein